MGATKTEGFSEAQIELATIAKAIGHPARVAILQHLLKVNICVGNELVDELPLAQPTISRHLKELKAVGLLKGTVEGTHVNYCIDSERWLEVKGILTSLFNLYQSDADCC